MKTRSLWLLLFMIVSVGATIITDCANTLIKQRKLPEQISVRSNTEPIVDRSLKQGATFALASGDRGKFRIGSDSVVSIGSLVPECMTVSDKLEFEAGNYRVKVGKVFFFAELRNGGLCNESPELVKKYDAKKQQICIFTNIFAVVKRDKSVKELIAIDFLLKTFSCEFVPEKPLCSFREGKYQQNESCPAAESCAIKVRAVNWIATSHPRNARVLTVNVGDAFTSQPIRGSANSDDITATMCPIVDLDADHQSSLIALNATATINLESVIALCYASVEVRVEDVNDNRPIIQTAEAVNIMCSRNESEVEEPRFLSLQLTDADSGVNSLVELSFSAINEGSGQFQDFSDLVTFANSETNSLNISTNRSSVLTSLKFYTADLCAKLRENAADRRSQPPSLETWLKITATDHGEPRLSSESIVHVLVEFPREASGEQFLLAVAAIGAVVTIALILTGLAWILYWKAKMRKKLPNQGGRIQVNRNNAENAARIGIGIGNAKAPVPENVNAPRSSESPVRATPQNGAPRRGLKIVPVTPSTSVQSAASTQTAVNTSRVFYHYHYHQHSLREPFHP